MHIYKKSLWGILSLWMCMLEAQSLHYQSTTGRAVTTIDWEVAEEEEFIHLHGLSSKGSVTMTCAKGFHLQKYEEVISSKHSWKISKEGVCLIIESDVDGKHKLKSFKVGETPWVQDFKFGLQEFLASDKRKFSFYIVNPKDLDVHEMIAVKEVEESVDVEGKVYETQKVKITLTGFKKSFWKAQVWYDRQTHVLVKYRANEGPGTLYTETVLLEKAQ